MALSILELEYGVNIQNVLSILLYNRDNMSAQQRTVINRHRVSQMEAVQERWKDGADGN